MRTCVLSQSVFQYIDRVVGLSNPYIPWSKFSLEKNSNEEPRIEPGTSWLVGNDVTLNQATEPNIYRMIKKYFYKFRGRIPHSITMGGERESIHTCSLMLPSFGLHVWPTALQTLLMKDLAYTYCLAKRTKIQKIDVWSTCRQRWSALANMCVWTFCPFFWNEEYTLKVRNNIFQKHCSFADINSDINEDYEDLVLISNQKTYIVIGYLITYFDITSTR